MRWQPVAEVPVDMDAGLIYTEGWQSWSPARISRLTDRPWQPAGSNVISLGYRAESPPGPHHQGEGLLAIQAAPGDPVQVFAGAPSAVPAIRAVPGVGSVRVEATGPVEHTTWPGPIEAALGGWAATFAVDVRAAPTAWCSWYHYFTDVTGADITENLDAMGELDLPIDVVQIDDGYQREIGDWLIPSDRFHSIAGLVEQIHAAGRRAGIWVAPFLVGERSTLARQHPQWLVPGVHAGRNWQQELRVLDVTQTAAARHLGEVFSALRGIGFDYFKLDFCYAGALAGPRPDGIAAYREGMRLIRAAVDGGYLVGCGAPILASVGLVDAMRIGPDTAAHVEPTEGDPSQPGQRYAIANGLARAWQNGRWWTNDPDCLLARPQVAQREVWAAHVERCAGLRTCSDRLRDLDEWGLAATRRYLAGPSAS